MPLFFAKKQVKIVRSISFFFLDVEDWVYAQYKQNFLSVSGTVIYNLVGVGSTLK